jgi:hypothetical protein
MNFQLSPELKSIMDELVFDWIRLHFTEIQEKIEEMKSGSTEYYKQSTYVNILINF